MLNLAKLREELLELENQKLEKQKLIKIDPFSRALQICPDLIEFKVTIEYWHYVTTQTYLGITKDYGESIGERFTKIFKRIYPIDFSSDNERIVTYFSLQELPTLAIRERGYHNSITVTTDEPLVSIVMFNNSSTQSSITIKYNKDRLKPKLTLDFVIID